MYLSTAHFSPTENPTVWNRDDTATGKLAQTWHFQSLDNDRYIIQQKLGGNVLANPVDEMERAHGLEFFLQSAQMAAPYRDTDPFLMAGQTFKLYPNEEGDGSFWIVSTSVAQPNLGAGDDLNLYLAPWDSGWGQRQLWFLEPVEEYPSITGAGRGPTRNALSPIPAMTDYARPQPDTTPEVLVGTTLLPSALVNDPRLDARQQARQSPWYLVRRYGFYRIGFYYDHSGTTRVVETQGITLGLTRTDVQSITRTTGLSVTAEASFGFKGFGASISTTYSQELSTYTSQEVTESSSKESTLQRQFNEGYRSALAIWYRRDRYALLRMDGTVVLDWETTVRDDAAERGYAPDKPPVAIPGANPPAG
ncbi:hypothetical protein ACIQCR_16935 [Streptomyces sp. NPDC093249]|uniref:hypothetical protein n=1 Tax=unclassified Streptomyces TaxID=2593676 RepID=UPI003450FD3B